MKYNIEITKNVVMLGVLFVCIGTLFACLLIIVLCNVFCPGSDEDKDNCDIEDKTSRCPVISETKSTLLNEIEQREENNFDRNNRTKESLKIDRWGFISIMMLL